MSDISPNPVISEARRFPLPFNGYAFGGILLGLSVIVGVLGVVLIVKSLVGDFGDYERVNVPGEGTVTIDDADTYRVFYEGEVCDDTGDSTSCDTFTVPAPTLEPADGGDPLELVSDSGFNYDFSGHEGVEVWRVRVDDPGEYDLSMSDVPANVVAVAVGKTPSVHRTGLLLAVAAAPSLGLAGTIAMIVTAVTRSRRRREAGPPQAPPSTWGPMPQPPGGQQPQPWQPPQQPSGSAPPPPPGGGPTEPV